MHFKKYITIKNISNKWWIEKWSEKYIWSEHQQNGMIGNRKDNEKGLRVESNPNQKCNLISSETIFN